MKKQNLTYEDIYIEEDLHRSRNKIGNEIYKTWQLRKVPLDGFCMFAALHAAGGHKGSVEKLGKQIMTAIKKKSLEEGGSVILGETSAIILDECLQSWAQLKQYYGHDESTWMDYIPSTYYELFKKPVAIWKLEDDVIKLSLGSEEEFEQDTIHLLNWGKIAPHIDWLKKVNFNDPNYVTNK